MSRNAEILRSANDTRNEAVGWKPFTLQKASNNRC